MSIQEENGVQLYGHSGSGNHGCEAIVRGTEKMLRRPLTLWSMHPEQDRQYGLDKLAALREDLDCPPQKPSLSYYLSAVEIKARHTTSLHTRFRRSALINGVKKGACYLSVGGDNYCYAGVETILELNSWMRRRGARTVLWGCSVEPELLRDPAVVRDMRGYSLITARESVTYQAMADAGLDNVILCADPAFQLEKADPPLPGGFVPGNTVGINVSPLAAGCGQGNLVVENYAELIAYILRETDMQVALIPHVVVPANDDRTVLSELSRRFQDSGRVIQVEDCGCMELKGHISRCRFFVGARTHATIAAYSTCVPTLVAGYSVKARGIARDIFGTEEGYVLPVQGLTDSRALTDAFQGLMEREAQIRAHLEREMPAYRERSFLAARALKERLGV